MTYLPAPVYQLTPPSACSGTNCVAASDAMLVNRSTAGREKPSAAHIRSLIGGACGGLTSDAVRYVDRVDYSLLCQQDNRAAWATLARPSQGFLLHGSYSVLNHTPHDASRNAFHGNHAIWVNGRLGNGMWHYMDPLADGRYAGCPKGYQDITDALLREFAGRLMTGSGAVLGLGFAMVLFSVPDAVIKHYEAIVHPLAGQAIRKFGIYPVVNGVINGGATIGRTGGFSATCSAPRRYHWAGHTDRSLVQLTSGARKGQYISSSFARVV